MADIGKALANLEIEAKETRKKTVRNILIIVLLSVIFYLIPYDIPQLSAMILVDVLIVILGGIWIAFSAISTLIQPLDNESYAFKEVTKAWITLEKSDDPIAYEEAYRCFKRAYITLSNLSLDELEWYKDTNFTLKRFFENMQLIVLPAIKNSKIKKEHLEQIALALHNTNVLKMATVNQMFEEEVEHGNYAKSAPPPKTMELLLKTFRESTIGRLIVSLIVGFGLVLIVCFIYSIGTQQDFITFAKDNPSIIILGGFGVSGATFWKTK
jgi:hypothetical protein